MQDYKELLADILSNIDTILDDDSIPQNFWDSLNNAYHIIEDMAESAQ